MKPFDTHPKSRWLASKPLKLFCISLAHLFFEYPQTLDRINVICDTDSIILSTAGSQASEKTVPPCSVKICGIYQIATCPYTVL